MLTEAKKEINIISDCLLNGGIVLLPTDTVYGLAVLPEFKESVEKLYQIKKRPRNLPLPIMVASSKYIEPLGLEINDNAKRLLSSRFVPGSLTLILGFKKLPLVSWLNGREEVGIRIPNDKRLLAILEKTGPLLVTSANIHGNSKIPQSSKEVVNQLAGKPNMIIKNGLVKSIPSTIVNCRFDPPIIERLGVITSKDLEICLNMKPII